MSPRAPEAEALAAHLGSYARASLESAVELAARLHAEDISYEHWLVALLEDESSAAARVVLHAFADPHTIAEEALALCAGTMVVGSGRTLPFSVLAVRALRAARDAALLDDGRAVGTRDLFAAAAGELPRELREQLESLPRAAGAETPYLAPSDEDADDGAPLLRHFSTDALRALGAACRTAGALERPAIGPAHVLCGALDSDPELRRTTGLTPARVRMAFAGRDEDLTPLPERTLVPTERLRELLRALPPEAETIEVLGWLLSHGSTELVSLLTRQKVTPALFERCRGIFHDPQPGILGNR